MNNAQQTMYQYTSIGRGLDPRYPTNVAILIFTTLAGVIAGILSLLAGETFGQAIQAGFYTGAATFLAWALAREFDPDHALAAFVGALLAFIASLLADVPPNIWLLGGLMVLARIINRIVGPPAKIADGIVGLIFTALAILSGWWIFGVVATAAYGLDAILPTPNRKMWIFAALALIGMFVFILINEAAKPYAEFTWWPVIFALSAATTGVIAITRVKCACDLPEFDIVNVRVQAAMGLMLFAGIVFALWAGNVGVVALLPLWAMMAGTTAWRVGAVIQNA